MTIRAYRIMAHAWARRTRCWKNRCYNSLGIGHRGQEGSLQPAFRDIATGLIYPSRFADGRLAPMHVWDGLPDTVVLERAPDGRVALLKETVVAGFAYRGHFYTREQATFVR